MKDCLSLEDFSKKEVERLLDLAMRIKRNPKKYRNVLNGKHVGLIFEKPSLRTKTAFYVGVSKLGGVPVYYSPGEVQIGTREKISDVAKTLSYFLDCVVFRTFEHENIKELAANMPVPVINALSDLTHPSQALADVMTIMEIKRKPLNKLKIVYIGDGNNVCHSLINIFSLIGGNFYAVCPSGYCPDKKFLDESLENSKRSGSKITVTHDPYGAVEDADVIYTDVWVSMGQEEEVKKRRSDFKSMQINSQLLARAKKNCSVMHCLPAHRGDEITDDVIDSANS
ncbi:MAG: ornithine carbamoyltransferase, partial [Candidatus Omnitrophica bacterium]|nr:ornithine carbamoyltransferase [Candidatus Omnitrophota bacterium]